MFMAVLLGMIPNTPRRTEASAAIVQRIIDGMYHHMFVNACLKMHSIVLCRQIVLCVLSFFLFLCFPCMEFLSPEDMRSLDVYAKIEHQPLFLSKEEADSMAKGVLAFQRKAGRIRRAREFVQRHAPCLSRAFETVLRLIYGPKANPKKMCK